MNSIINLIMFHMHDEYCCYSLYKCISIDCSWLSSLYHIFLSFSFNVCIKCLLIYVPIYYFIRLFVVIDWDSNWINFGIGRRYACTQEERRPWDLLFIMMINISWLIDSVRTTHLSIYIFNVIYLNLLVFQSHLMYIHTLIKNEII